MYRLSQHLLRFRRDCIRSFGSKAKAHKYVRETINSIRGIDDGYILAAASEDAVADLEHIFSEAECKSL